MPQILFYSSLQDGLCVKQRSQTSSRCSFSHRFHVELTRGAWGTLTPLYSPFSSAGQPPAAAADDGHELPDGHLPLLPGHHAPHHRPADAAELSGSAPRPARQVPDVPPAVGQRGRRAQRSGQDAAAEREPAAVAGVRLRRPAARLAAAVRQRQHGAGAAAPAELGQGVRESAGNHQSERAAVAPAAVAAAAAAPAQTHHEQTGNTCTAPTPTSDGGGGRTAGW